MYVRFLGKDSEMYTATSGVPAGCLFGPLLFIISINNIGTCLKVSSMAAYCDDVRLTKVITSKEDCLAFQEDINRIFKWCEKHNFSMNTGKTNIISFSRKKEIIKHDYQVDSVTLNRVESISDLGVIFDSRLMFTDHFKKITADANRILGFIIRNCKHVNDIDIILLLYYTFVRSKLEYNACVWNPEFKKWSKLIESVQARLVRYLFWKANGFYPSFPEVISYDLLRENLGLESLEKRRDISQLQLVWKIFNSKIDCTHLLSLFNINVPDVRLRNAKQIFFKNTGNLNLRTPISKISVCFNENYDKNIDISMTWSSFKKSLGQL